MLPGEFNVRKSVATSFNPKLFLKNLDVMLFNFLISSNEVIIELLAFLFNFRVI